MSRNRLSIVVLLSFLGAVVSGLLLFEHHGVDPAEQTVQRLCGAEGESGCDLVSQSRYSSLGKFSLAAVGLLFYASMLLLFALGVVSSDAIRESVAGFALLLFGIALAIDVVLFGLQAFSIGAFCRLCLATYVMNVLAMVTLLPARSHLTAFLRGSGEGRRPLAVWAVGSFILIVGIGAVDRALASAGAEGEMPLLGEAPAPVEDPPPVPVPDPEPAPTPVATSPPPVNGDQTVELRAALQAAEAKVRELQSTLDDPGKYQDYQAKKAAEDFQKETPVDLDLAGVSFKGPADAPVKVVEFSDFLCPFCRNLAGAFGGYMPQSQGRVAIFFKNYPLDQACNPALPRTVHDGACELALGSICAEEQGKFWPYHDRVFSQPPTNPSNDDVVRFATEAGLDGAAMRECLGSASAKAKLDRDIQEGSRVKVTGTPTVFVNGKRLRELGGFLQAIELELKRLGITKS